MKLVFSQKHIELLSLGNLTVVQFLCLTIETSKLLGWVFGIYKQWVVRMECRSKMKIKNRIATLQSESWELTSYPYMKTKKVFKVLSQHFKA